MRDDSNDPDSFVPLNEDNYEVVGPPAALLYGFEPVEAHRVASLLHDIGAEGHQVVGCTTTMGQWTVARALEGGDDGKLLPVGGVPRILLLSGLTDRQVHQMLDAYRATGMPRPVFAVATPTNLSFTVVQLLEDLMADLRANAQ